jgi:alpha-glucosidase
MNTVTHPFAFHAPTPDLLFVKDGKAHVRLKFPESLKIEAAWVRTEPDNEQFLSPMKHVTSEDGWQLWEGVPKLETSDDVTLYAFKFITGGVQHWLSEHGLTPHFPERDIHFRYVPSYQAASWVWSQVFYQIFPERFFDGDPSNNVKDGEYEYMGKPVVSKQWAELPDRKQGQLEFYGGDLEGIRQKIPYLQDLGVTALYLNPVFTSPSNHKYDTVDYDNVDPHFGGNEALEKLCAELKQKGVRLILDAVVNHTSERHPWFDFYGEYTGHGEHSEVSAYKSKEAKTRDFYTFLEDERFVSFYDVPTMPILNFANEEVQQLVYKGKDAILRKWLRPPYSIDGWRFDVVHMLGEGPGAKNNAKHVRGFKQALREENPQAYMLGEHFFEATKWLQGDQEDGAMNYFGFTLPLREFLSGLDNRKHPIAIDATHLDYMWRRARARLPFPIQLSQFNLLGSHDVSRIRTALKSDFAHLKLAVTALFTYIGVPCIYYGDEVGLEGADDPDCRRTFPWNKHDWDHDLLAYYKKLIALRKTSNALQEGGFLALFAEGDVYAYARILKNQSVITVLNRGKEVAVTLPVWKMGQYQSLTSFFDNTKLEVKDGQLELSLPPRSSLVLLSS